MSSLTGRVAVVTGASRGIGKGIAVALGAAGATVYITGRSVDAGSHELPGTIGDTAAEVTRRGGTGIAVAVDHADDAQVTELFNRVRTEAGRLDILVNNAFALPDDRPARNRSGTSRYRTGRWSMSACDPTSSRRAWPRRSWCRGGPG